MLDPQLAQVAGGDGGNGGSAEAIGGKGGAGSQQQKRGGDGGDIESTGGDGGNALYRALDGSLVGEGGDGGMSRFAGGFGAEGWTNSCSLPDGFLPGGDGGNGGAARGGDGAGGSGRASGNPGNVVVDARTGNAGRGGQGEPHGATGTTTDAIVKRGTRTNVAPLGFTRLVPFPCVNVSPVSHDVAFTPNTLCGSPSLRRAISISNLGVSPIQAAVTVVNPAGAFHDLFISDAQTGAGFTGGQIPPDNANTGAGPQPSVTRACGGLATPAFYCLRFETFTGPTNRVFRIPLRMRPTAAPRDEAADIAACAGIP